MSKEVTCPICQNFDFKYLQCKCTKFEDNDKEIFHFNCDVCGKFSFTDEALEDFIDDPKWNNNSFPQAQRSVVSHWTKVKTIQEGFVDTITNNNIDQLFSTCSRPTIDQQMNNIFKFLGCELDRTGDRLKSLPIDIHSIVGSLNRVKVVELFSDLKGRGLIDFSHLNNKGRWEPQYISLTYEGSKYYSQLIKNV